MLCAYACGKILQDQSQCSDGHENECMLCSVQQEADESLNFEEQILEAAKSIAAATSALVKAASAAQRELVAQGKV